MERTVWAIESKLGYLREVEEYTTDINKAAVFVDVDVALKQLRTLRKLLKQDCRVSMRTLPFPRLEKLPNV